MKVYVVVVETDYEGSDVTSIYNSQQKAEMAAKLFNEKSSSDKVKELEEYIGYHQDNSYTSQQAKDYLEIVKKGEFLIDMEQAYVREFEVIE